MVITEIFPDLAFDPVPYNSRANLAAGCYTDSRMTAGKILPDYQKGRTAHNIAAAGKAPEFKTLQQSV